MNEDKKIAGIYIRVSTDENKDKYFKLLIEREDDLQAPENLVFHYDRQNILYDGNKNMDRRKILSK